MIVPPNHLLHVGYPKAGTSFVKAWCAAHPEVRFSYGGLAGLAGAADVLDPRASAFGAAVTSEERFVVAGLGAQGVSREEVAARVAALFPGSRVLILTRGFEAMLRSSYSQLLRTGDARTRAALWGERDGWLEYLDYDGVAELYEGHFGPEAVTVLPYELLRDDPDAFLDEVARPLGVARHGVDPGRVNPSMDRTGEDWHRRISGAAQRAAHVLPKSRRLLGWYRRKWVDTRRVERVARRLARWAPIGGDDAAEQAALDALLPRLAARAARLRERPFFRPYAAAYGAPTRTGGA